MRHQSGGSRPSPRGGADAPHRRPLRGLAEAAAAHRALESRGTMGKVVLVP
ncbi:hypothetical protein [Streptomyces sp. A1-5]|uniref:hypothetical protein n=1 Tax=Streptomyces sp. A1-5 TaxID=2738410 RepID=UPI001F2E726D|nr:hypothetical protein [Streptomyces sp. A1-5]UJB39489.1 hypothetical protein HRD51_23695 [Streptomyces sp. A1-5]